MSKRKSMARALAALAVVGFAVATSACELEVKNPGAILEEDLNNPDLMRTLVVGASAERSDAVEANTFSMSRLVDESVASGSYASTADLRRGIITEDDTNGEWAQTHEAAWAAGEAVERITNVLGTGHAEFAELVSRLYFLQGTAYNQLGETFCEVAFSGGGEFGGRQPKSAAFERAVTSFQNAIDVAGSDPDAAQWVTGAHAGLAQAYVGLGMWTEAAQEAAQVPTDFERVAFFDQSDNTWDVWIETHDRPEFTAWHTIADLMSDDAVPDDMYDPLLDTGAGMDPRAPFTICGYRDTSTGLNVEAGGCPFFQGADGFAPHYRQERFPSQASDVPLVSGVEMRLIEAEADLRAGDLVGFAAGVNAVRDHYGLDQIAVPTAAGTLDGMFTDNDAWSILDRERWLTLWLQGRRMWDLYRWDHPFIQGGRLTDQYPVQNPRAACYPIPESECDLNPNISCN